MQRRVLPFLVLGIVVCLPMTALAVSIISIGALSMAPTDSLTVVLTATGTDPVAAIDFRNWINGGLAGGPFITQLDGFGVAPADAGHLFTGAFSGVDPGPPDGVFGGGNTGTQTGASGLNFANPPAASLPFATVHLATLGAAPGVYSWSLTNPGLLGPTTFYDIAFFPTPTILIDGTITVTPEPSTLALAAFGFVALAAGGVRRNRQNR